jgi:ATP-dependent Zn protease
MEHFDWMGTLINWFPMILIFGVWFFFMRQMRGGPYSRYQKDCFELQRRQTEALERLVAAVEKRSL